MLTFHKNYLVTEGLLSPTLYGYSCNGGDHYTMDLHFPFTRDADPLEDRTIDVDIASAILLLAALGFYAAPVGTGVLVLTIATVILTHRLGRWLGTRLDGWHWTVSVPGVGTLDFAFTPR